MSKRINCKRKNLFFLEISKEDDSFSIFSYGSYTIGKRKMPMATYAPFANFQDTCLAINELFEEYNSSCSYCLTGEFACLEKNVLDTVIKKNNKKFKY